MIEYLRWHCPVHRCHFCHYLRRSSRYFYCVGHSYGDYRYYHY